MKPATNTDPPRRRRPILVVEDDPFVLSMLMRTLESFGYEAEEATDGPEALDLARGGDYGLVLLDRTLPRMSGVEVLRELKRDPRTASVPVLFVTAMVDGAEEVLAAGAAECLPKPFERAALRRAVETYLPAG